jgi:hypothetical protein|tara:strand:+ start:1044 stop:1550 length:507 start_codon:yes stop_codon:yes gene_type:complete
MNTLVQHIEAINVNTQIWVDADPKNRWAGMVVTDPKHWAEYGITTPAEYDRYQDENTLYELASTAYSKSYARSLNSSDMSDAELQKAITQYGKQAEEQIAFETKMEDENIANFEDRVLDTINDGAGNRETAIRWILDAEGLSDERDPGFVCYKFGLPYSMENQFKRAA